MAALAKINWLIVAFDTAEPQESEITQFMCGRALKAWCVSVLAIANMTSPAVSKFPGSVPCSVKEIGEGLLCKTPCHNVLTCLVPSSMVSLAFTGSPMSPFW